MTDDPWGGEVSRHRIGTREEWLTARLELLEAEKELTRRSDELARQRQALPWVRVDKDYRFETGEGTASLRDLFRGRSQLLVYHFMFPSCPSCASMADGFNGFVVHLENHDVAMIAVSRSPIAELTAFKKRMGWSFPLVSSLGSDFNFDFGVSFTDQQLADGAVYNFRALPPADPESLPNDLPGTSAFAVQDDVVYHTYSSYARGGDVLWGMYQWLDRAPKGRNESGEEWVRLRDEYDNETP
ncbi:DUF899 domain-containing protein [Nocardia iowensis]|uniref:DUF899 domain-containing protein n=1 Tax=Nocardia iowensis TaxID=204891 RepID=A0ABX8RFU5_NOCIO|nr:DUF899 family protein [Nocardia iowensis]QXN88477.1 DUF899 domain-containing protein [Nocardia iowensis]